MRFTSGRFWLAGAALVLPWILTPAALALPFSSSCDRFEVDGNAFGPFDGTADLVDDFNDGVLAPNWSPLIGTVGETGGALVAHDPGANVPLGNTVFEISTAENALHDIEQGAGNFTMTSQWPPTLPGADDELHMQLYSIAPVIEAVGITVNNLSAQVATQLGNGAIAGYSVSQSVTQGVGSGFTTVRYDTAPIAPASITGPIVLRMSLDDTSDMATCAFSLDGGATFQSPFPPMHAFNLGVTDYEVLLGAAALTPNTIPTSTQTLPLQLLVVKSRATPESRRVTYKASFPPGQGFLIGNPIVGGAKFHLKLDAVSQCFSMPSSGWTRNGPFYKYIDRTGVNGPVKVAWLRQKSNGAIQNKVVVNGARGPIDVVPPNPGIQADANFHVGGGSEYCTSTAGGTIRPNDARTFKARNAPAPASCYVPACSPSGAFLDVGE